MKDLREPLTVTLMSLEDSQRAEYAEGINTVMNPITCGCR